MGKYFIYVFSKDARDSLIKNGFMLVGRDEANDIYVFANKLDLNFSFDGIKHIKSDTLTL